MYADAVVIAGIATVLLMVAFFVGVGIFVVRDAKHPRVRAVSHPEESAGSGQKH